MLLAYRAQCLPPHRRVCLPGYSPGTCHLSTEYPKLGCVRISCPAGYDHLARRCSGGTSLLFVTHGGRQGHDSSDLPLLPYLEPKLESHCVTPRLVAHQYWYVGPSLRSYRTKSLVGTHSVTLHFFRTQFVSLETIRPILNTTFPLHLAQNVLTTGLITYKIWTKHVETKRAGMQTASTAAGLNLIGVIRIVIESAAVYTLQMVLAVILQLIDHPARVLLQHCLIPSTGTHLNSPLD